MTILTNITILLIVCYFSNADSDVTNAGDRLELAALGRVAQIGELYDARSEKFLDISLFNEKLRNTSIISTQNGESKLQYEMTNTFKEKIKIIDLSAELSVSLLAGLVELKASGRFFQDKKQSYRSAKVTMIESITTVYDEIIINEKDLQPSIEFDVLKEIDATHIVIGIQWGGNVFISCEDTNTEEHDILTVQGSLSAGLKKISGVLDVHGKGSVNITDSEMQQINSTKFEMYGDILPEETPQSVIDAIILMKKAPALIRSSNNGKGNAMRYSLISLNNVRKLFKTELLINSIVKTIGDETIKKCVELFDNMNFIEQKVGDLNSDVTSMEPYIETKIVKEIKQLQHNYTLHQARLRADLSEKLLRVRSGNESVDRLEEVIIKSSSEPYSWENVEIKLLDYDIVEQEISFIKQMMQMNVTILNKKTSLQLFLWENFRSDVYLLFYNFEFSNKIDKPLNTFRKMIEYKESLKIGQTGMFVAVNYAILDERKNEQFANLKEKPKISLFKNASLIIEDYQIGEEPDECKCGDVVGKHCGIRANKNTTIGMLLSGNCFKEGLYQCYNRHSKAEYINTCANCTINNKIGYDWCDSTDPVSKLCRCGLMGGEHCGSKTDVPIESGFYGLTGDCIGNALYNCKMLKLDDPAQLIKNCTTCMINNKGVDDICSDKFIKL